MKMGRAVNVLLYFYALVVIIQTTQAATITISSVAVFSNPIPSGDGAMFYYCGGPGQDVCSQNDDRYKCPSGMTAQCPSLMLRWGKPAQSSPSGVGFQSLSNTQTLSGAQTTFSTGELTHFNFPINSGTGASGFTVNFTLTMSGAFNFQQQFSFGITVDETPNLSDYTKCKYPSTPSGSCADKLDFDPSVGVFAPTVFSQPDGNVYTVSVWGFKDSLDPTAPTGPFLSQENTATTKILVADIIQCPDTCVNNAKYIIVKDSAGKPTCACQCSNTCQSPLIRADTCACQCPNGNSCNGGQISPTTCQCTSCTGATCPGNKVPVLSDYCNCHCPQMDCGAGTQVTNGDTCSCSCANVPCPQPYLIPNPAALCQCQCDATALATFCATKPGFISDPNSCTCKCDPNVVCTHSLKDPSTCQCGACQGNWQGTGCLTCGLTNQDCANLAPNYVLNSQTCQCQCPAVPQCSGSTPIFDPPCACRACIGIECCGNGVLDAGEQCDPSASNSPGNPQCCDNCQFTSNLCSDGNLCTVNDQCSASTGQCAGTSKVCTGTGPCSSAYCDAASGNCILDKRLSGPCGSETEDQLCFRSCVDGSCVENPVVCTPPDSVCKVSGCVVVGGTPQCQAGNAADTTTCNDGLPCTVNDHCVSGTCIGDQPKCPDSTDPCYKIECTDNGLCQQVPVPNARRVPCDDHDPCTINDHCTPAMTCVGGEPLCPEPRDSNCWNQTCEIQTNSNGTAVASCDVTIYSQNNCTYVDPVTGEIDACVIGACKLNETLGIGTCQSNGTVSACSGGGGGDSKKAAIISGTVAGAAVVGAGAALAGIIRKVRRARLLDPDSWEPAELTGVESNPLYKDGAHSHVNQLYEA